MNTVVLDFETYYTKDYSLSKMTTEAYIRDPRFQVIGFSYKEDDQDIVWVTGTHQEIASKLRDLHLENKAVIAHNAVFDVAILSWVFGIKPKFIIDTMSMARPVIGLTESCSLRNLAEHYGLGHKGDEIYNTLGRRYEDFEPEDLKRFGEYCRQDVNLTAQLYPLLRKETTKQELYLIDTVLRMFTEPVLELDSELLTKHLEEEQEKNAKLMELVGASSRDDFMSNDKFAELLRAEGVEPPKKVSATTGKEAYAFAKTDQEFKALLEHPNERVQALVAARLGLKSTIEETRTQAFLEIASRGTLPIQLLYYGAPNTGRFSGSGAINPQNLPRGGVLRHSMRAPKGYKVVACDSSNIEVRVEAWLAGEENLLQVFRDKGDVYCNFGSKVYGRPINKHDDPEERRISKTAVLGLGYGTGWKKLQFALRNGGTTLPDEECQRIVNMYRQVYANIKRMWYACGKALDRMYDGYEDTLTTAKLKCDPVDKSVLLPNMLKLRYPDLARVQGQYGWEYSYRYKKFMKRIYGASMVENITQAIARIVVGYQMCTIRQALDKMSREKHDGKIRQVVHFVHDEVVVVVPEEEAKEVEEMMTSVMSTPPSWAPDLPVDCEAGGGDTYGDAK